MNGTKVITPRHRKVFKLRTVGFTFEEIGERLNITRQRAHQLFVVAKVEIRRELRSKELVSA